MIIHTVQSGDTVRSIAREYGVSPFIIIAANGLTSPDTLAVGQALAVPVPAQTYTAVEGDTVESVAAQFGTTPLRIFQNNPWLMGQSTIPAEEEIVISYTDEPTEQIETNGYAYPFINEDVLRTTLPFLTYVSVFTYGLGADGTLIPPEVDDTRVITLAREYGTVPLLTLTSLNEDGNFSNDRVNLILSDPALGDTIIRNTAATVAQKGYGGVDVDFEYISAAYREAYISFIERMQAALGELPVFVSLAPKISATQPGLLYEAHDYGGLGQAADKVLLMTYEWGYTYGPPLAVAPINQVRRVVTYALTEIPADKIFLGTPNYGYNWTLPYEQGVSRAQSLSNVDATALAQAENAEIEFDPTALAPFFRYTDDEGREHVVWFEDARSVAATLDLVREFDLNGIGVWNILRYFPALWTVLNGEFRIRKIGTESALD